MWTHQDQHDMCFGTELNATKPGQNCLCNSGIRFRPYGCLSADPWLMPLLFALPIWFRLMQCIRTSIYEPTWSQILNLLRYISCFITIALSVVGGDERGLLGCIGKSDHCTEDE